MISGRTLRIVGIGLVIAAIAGAQWARDRHLRKRYEARIEEMVAAGREQVTPASPTPAVEAPPRLVDLSITPRRREIMREAMPAFDPEVEVEVPFTLFATPSHKARLLMRPARLASVLEVTGLGRISFPRDGVPLKMVELAPGRLAVFFREMFSGHLYLFRVGAKVEHEIRIRGPKDAEPILREAVVHNGKLLAILYDNERGVNEVVALDTIASYSEVTPKPIATLPTLEDPAGTHYEMMPTLFMLPIRDELWIVGGTLVSRLGGSGLAEEHRLRPCERAQEVVAAEAGPVVLCLAKSNGESAFMLSRWKQGGIQADYIAYPIGTVPFNLRMADSKSLTDSLDTTAQIAGLLRRDLTSNQVSGVMELSSNNIEGRIAWSQVYFLNGLMDLLRMAQLDNDAFDRLSGLVADAKRRLDIEMYLIDRLLESAPGYETKAFTVKREPALFAVQTARLLLLFNRYAREFEQRAVLRFHARLLRDVTTLAGHIEEMRIAGPGSKSPKPGRHYMAWPKGSASYFDGLNVPYNHQNEWAYAILDSLKDNPIAPVPDTARTQVAQIINHFLEEVAPQGAFPASGEWPYWWGKAREGWTEAENVSANTRSYSGDKSIAFISFRSIDIMSTLAAARVSERASHETLLQSAQRLVAKGQVYPFVAASFVGRGYRPALERRVALHYLRLTAPWELQSAIWAMLDVPVKAAQEDPHSLLLNARVIAAVPEIREKRPDASDAIDVLARYLAIAIPYNVEQAWLHSGLELGGKILAWNLAYDLDAAAAAYERTNDPRFANVLEIGLDAAMAMRDDRLGRRDEVRERSMPAWGTNRYSPQKQKWMAWDAFTGIIAHPAIVYADVIRHRGDDGRKAKAERYLKDVIEAVEAFDEWWREDWEAATGWYFDALYLDVAPLNHMSLLGLAHIELCKRLGHQSSCRKAESLARFFKTHLKREADGACTWEYWAGAQLAKHRSSAGEDVTHAHINVRFAHLAWRNAMVIDDADIACIAKALTHRIMRPTGDWAVAVDGTGKIIESKLHEGLSAWMVLADIDASIPKRIDEFMLAHPDAYPLGLLSYATGPASFARRLAGGR